MKRRGSTGDLERLGKRRKVMKADDILHEFAESRLKTAISNYLEYRLTKAEAKGHTEFSKQKDLGRKLSILARLPRADIANPRFVDLVNRIISARDIVGHDDINDAFRQEIIVKIHPYPHPITIEQWESGRFAIRIDGLDIFTTVGGNTVRCAPSKWAELEMACFGTSGGSSFLLRCLSLLPNEDFREDIDNNLDYEQPVGGYLCYPFFREFRTHLVGRLRESLGNVLIPELVSILLDYSSPPFERDGNLWFKKRDQIHEHYDPRRPKSKKNL